MLIRTSIVTMRPLTEFSQSNTGLPISIAVVQRVKAILMKQRVRVAYHLGVPSDWRNANAQRLLQSGPFDSVSRFCKADAIGSTIPSKGKPHPVGVFRFPHHRSRNCVFVPGISQTKTVGAFPIDAIDRLCMLNCVKVSGLSDDITALPGSTGNVPHAESVLFDHYVWCTGYIRIMIISSQHRRSRHTIELCLAF